MATGSVIGISEILKNNNFAVLKDIKTSTVKVCNETTGRIVCKAKLEISMGKSKVFEEVLSRANPNLKKING
ncbi:hypothetical protein ZOSMA_63G00620 [Zostera marina]|uniref:Uncharacterized protein n=1 Tax=Zostera marina TaxID=29655 RepID=A0A0K9NT36_ZOSMR|nr:hypothetical protein ZOSMA_63G00620 [Zostera marina]